MPAFIRKPQTNLYLELSIDSSGMSVGWVPFNYATTWPSSAEAQQFIDSRLRERYPEEELMVEYHS